MSSIAEHTIIVYKSDVYRFAEYREQYEDYVYIQCFQEDLLSLGIIGFFVRLIEKST